MTRFGRCRCKNVNLGKGPAVGFSKGLPGKNHGNIHGNPEIVYEVFLEYFNLIYYFLVYQEF